MNNLLFFTSPIGLGHATRDIAISQHLDDIPKKFVSGAGAANLFSQYGFEVEDFYNPPPFRIDNGNIQNPLRWLFSYYSFYKDCKRISSQIIDKESPKFIVSDEDFASLAVAQKKKIKTVLVTDILETRFTNGAGSIIEKIMNRSMRDIIEKCDLVLIPEIGKDTKNIVRIGPIVREIKESREQLRKKYSFNKRTVVVSIGGTDSGKFLLDRTVEAFSEITLDADLVIVSGPAFKFEDTRYRNLGFVSNLHEIIYASDLIISLAGKSTIDESTHYGTPGIFIPIKGHFEQEENAKKVGYSYQDIFGLKDLIMEMIERGRDPRPYDGAKLAAEKIRSFL